VTTYAASMTLPEALASRAPQAFPTLTHAQIGRICAHGHLRPVTAGEVLVEPGDADMSLFVVKRGKVQVFRVFGDAESLLIEYGPGQFSGELVLLSGRPALGRIRVAESGEVIEVDRQSLLAFVQTDPELGEIIMRAFILRRMGLIASQTGDVVALGSNHSADTLRVKEFLTRNGHPYKYIDLDREADMQDLLDRFHVGVDDIPVLICRGDVVLRKPTNEQIADCLGFNNAIDPAEIHDVIVVGAGPAGLAAAVYAASEGLGVLVLETVAPGGQAGSSSKIENYLGFPNGISGLELAGRAYNQALKFGAQFAIARGAARLTCDRKPFAVDLGDGAATRARAIIIATGAEYRKLPLENLSRFVGVGVYYSATFMESQLCRDEEVIIVGGGNSAGQAAVFLAGGSRHVHLLVRSGGLASSMSQYLIRRIEESPNITLHTHTEIAALEGTDHLERVLWRNNQTGHQEEQAIRHVFLMTGAMPNTGWLAGCLALDNKGFIKTGGDLSAEDLAAAHWPLTRPPFPLETSLPGVFAVGDVRCGNVKRVASAVGEGSVAVSQVHQALRD